MLYYWEKGLANMFFFLSVVCFSTCKMQNMVLSNSVIKCKNQTITV